MTKNKLIEILQNLLGTNTDLGFLLVLKEEDLEHLVACVREKIESE